jgi:hypothetical protein
MVLALTGADSDKKNSAGETDSASDRRKGNAVALPVRDLQRSELGVLFFDGPVKATPGKANNANDD